jgi:GTP-binding protein HflX
MILHVVDGSDPEPEAQIAAVRSVLAEIGAGEVPELVVINKSDAADPIVVESLRRREGDCVLVSARTGAGLDDLRDALEEALPRRDREVQVLLPYSRGDLIARVHEEGEVLGVGHGADGTELQARVPPALAAELAQFSTEPGEPAEPAAPTGPTETNGSQPAPVVPLPAGARGPAPAPALASRASR